MDSLWTFLYKVLERFGFHKIIIRTIQTLYDKPSARVKINGDLSNDFILQRGCRQGCPVSPLLFAIFIEPLSQWIRQNNDIKGVDMAGGEQKISLFADDVLIYLTQPEQSFPELMKSLESYGSLSGYKLNVKKTQALTFNYNPSQETREKYNIKWDSDFMRYLGVDIPRDLEKLSETNYKPLISRIKADIARWNLLPFLGLSSRIAPVKMNVLPRLLYLFQTLPVAVTEKQFIEWDRMISRFVWQGKRPRIRRKTLKLPKEKGGMALPCLKDYYNAAQLRPLVCWCNPDYNAKWKDIESDLVEGVPLQALIGDGNLMGNLTDMDQVATTDMERNVKGKRLKRGG